MHDKTVNLTPPPEKKSEICSEMCGAQEQNYEHLISNCTLLCKNYARLLYVYNHLLGEYRDIVTHNRDIVIQYLSRYEAEHPAPEKKGKFTRYLSEQGFVPYKADPTDRTG
ncbi:hypothetical protein V1L52_02935 [Treponema sp. HNW]|uniref:hypothetical protein n=1 Tax=Treponema sp. HNW TaxID=3116654 RepID=UPI003D0E1C88